MRSRFLLAIVLLVCLPAIAAAQETLVPIDSAGSLDRIDAELEAKLVLFPETAGFREARLYALSDGSFVLEVSFERDGRQGRERRPLSADAARGFRQRVTEALRTTASVTLDQQGRALYVTGTTVLGLGYYGPAAIIATDAEDKGAVAVYMLTAATGFFVPYLVTQHSQVTKAQAKLSLYGLAAGALHGHLLYMLGGGDYDFNDEQVAFASSIAVGLAEGIAGYYLAGAHNLSEGKVDVIASLGTFGLGFGAGATFLADGESSGAVSAGMLLGTVAGFVAGNTVANMQNYSSGDATVMTTAGMVGAWVPVGILMVGGLEADTDGDAKIYTASAMAGAAGGIILGHNLVGGRQFTDAQGNYVALGTAASTALGLGLAYLLSPDDGDYKLFAGSALVGSVGGFALMYTLLEDDAPREIGASLRFDISPAAIGAFAMGRRPTGTASVPMAGMSYRF